MLDKLQKGTPFAVAATGSSTTVATQSGVVGAIPFITDIAGSSDLSTAVLTVKQGTTVIWEMQIGTTPFSQRFESPLPGVSGGAVSVTVTGTTLSKANIAGITLP